MLNYRHRATASTNRPTHTETAFSFRHKGPEPWGAGAPLSSRSHPPDCLKARHLACQHRDSAKPSAILSLRKAECCIEVFLDWFRDSSSRADLHPDYSNLLLATVKQEALLHSCVSPLGQRLAENCLTQRCFLLLEHHAAVRNKASCQFLNRAFVYYTSILSIDMKTAQILQMGGEKQRHGRRRSCQAEPGTTNPCRSAEHG